MPRYLAMMPLEFCGQTFKQNDYIDVPDKPSEAEQRDLERLHAARALRHSPPKAPSPGASRDRAMEPEPHRDAGYKTRAGSRR